MSSSEATTSCVATSGFHCSEEQRLRLRCEHGQRAGLPSAPCSTLSLHRALAPQQSTGGCKLPALQPSTASPQPQRWFKEAKRRLYGMWKL